MTQNDQSGRPLSTEDLAGSGPGGQDAGRGDPAAGAPGDFPGSGVDPAGRTGERDGRDDLQRDQRRDDEGWAGEQVDQQRGGMRGGEVGDVGDVGDRRGTGDAGYPSGSADVGGMQAASAGSGMGTSGGRQAAGADAGGRQAADADAGGAEVALLGDTEQSGFRQRWGDVQAQFVDDPRQAVQAADGLVAELMQALAQGFSQHKTRLESEWARGGDPDTEELRQALQRYRSFFNRLLST